VRGLQPLGGEETDAHGVHEAVVLVGLVEHRLAPHRRDADRVPVAADPSHGLLELVARAGEAESVQQGDRPSTHRDDVAQDPADAGRSALERLDRRGVVVRLDLERDRFALAEVDHACVLTGAQQDTFTRGGKPLQEER